jgi:predicted permease
MVLVLTAAQPCGVNLYLFAQRYEVGQALATTSVFISSVLSMFSLTLLLFMFAQATT